MSIWTRCGKKIQVVFEVVSGLHFVVVDWDDDDEADEDDDSPSVSKLPPPRTK